MPNISNAKATFATAIGGDHTIVTASYAAVGSRTTVAAIAMTVSSSYNLSVFLSLDGTNNQLFIPAGTSTTYNFGANQESQSILYLPAGSQFYIKQGPDGAAASGDLFITLMYGA